MVKSSTGIEDTVAVFSNWGDCALRGHLRKSGDIIDCPSGMEGATDI